MLAVLLLTEVFAQDSQPQLRTPIAVNTRFGLRGGLTLAKLHFEDMPSGSGIDKTQSKTSFNAGVFVNVPIGGLFRFQPEVNVSSQGGKYEGANSTSLGEHYLPYINVQLNFQLQTLGGFFVQTVSQLGYLFEAKVKDQTGDSGSVDDQEDFDKIDFAWTAGVG